MVVQQISLHELKTLASSVGPASNRAMPIDGELREPVSVHEPRAR